MYRWILALGAASFLLYGADEQHLALALRAESDFYRVQLSANPPMRDATTCIQAEAALIPVALPEELATAHFRKGYCLLAEATVTHNTGEFLDAATEIDRAIGTWPVATKNKPAPPMPSAILVLASLARLQAGADESVAELSRNGIRAALASPDCVSNLMPVVSCQKVLETGREWLGWFALRAGNLDEAATNVAGLAGSGWPAWVAGRKAFRQGSYAEAVADYKKAIEILHPEAFDSLAQRLGPPADKPAELTELGGAQMLAGDMPGAIVSLDAAFKSDPSDARALYLRGRAHELSGQAEAALADYNLASRTAFANAKDLVSGEAHLYRGILYYRRKDYTHAEAEFASALNFTIDGGMREDAVAWRHLAAVASGSCGASRERLEQWIAKASPYFPKEEARVLAAGCPASAASVRSPEARGSK